MKPLLSLFFASAIFACGSVAIDDTGPGNRLFQPQGVIQGSVVYSGPHPCSSGGHIVGNAIILFFNQDDPPPPQGIASTAVNFGVVSGESLFVNEPRYTGTTVYCPKDHGVTGTITASAPFAVSPFAAGTYIAEAFFDYTGDFLPTFKFRELPEEGDVGGGYIDTADALMHVGDVNYQPIFLPIQVGVPAGIGTAGEAGADGGVEAGSLVIPPSGYDANNVTITMGEVLTLARPYFYPVLGTKPAPKALPTTANPSGNVDYVPVVTMAQDIHVLAPPPISGLTEANTLAFQDSFAKITLDAGVPPAELTPATDPSGPFRFQLSPPNSLFIWTSGTSIPENTLVPSLYPQVVFTKLIDDPSHTADPQSLTQETPPAGPVVVTIGITLGATDSLYDAALMEQPSAPGPSAASGHVTALIRPTVVCLDPNDRAAGATLVTPFFTGTSADPKVTGQQSLFNQADVVTALEPIFGNVTVVQGCLPPGRFAINLVYPTGQAWTVPNESGSCAVSEGTLDLSTTPPSCSIVPPGANGSRRDVLYSQGTRGVVEILESPGSATCAAFPVPAACLPAAK
jgi:hypothetical protein